VAYGKAVKDRGTPNPARWENKQGDWIMTGGAVVMLAGLAPGIVSLIFGLQHYRAERRGHYDRPLEGWRTENPRTGFFGLPASGTGTDRSASPGEGEHGFEIDLPPALRPGGVRAFR
jgi:hypothetical protein